MLAREARAHQAIEVIHMTVAGSMEVADQTTLDVADVRVFTTNAWVVEPSVIGTIRRGSHTERSTHLAAMGYIASVNRADLVFGSQLLATASRTASLQIAGNRA